MNAKLLLSLKAVFMSLCKDLEESQPQEQVPMLYLTLPAFSPRPSVPGWPDSRNPLIPPSSLSKKKKKRKKERSPEPSKLDPQSPLTASAPSDLPNPEPLEKCC